MKRILHISKFYPPYQGGIEDTCSLIINHVAGYEYQVICFNDQHKNEISYDHETKIIRIGTWKTIASQPISFSYIIHLHRVLKWYRPDIVHFHAPNPLISLYVLLLLNRTIKLVLHWHSDVIEQRNTVYLLYKPIERLFLKRADKIIITTPNYLEASESLRPFKKKITSIYSIVDPSKFKLTGDDEIKIAAIKQRFGRKRIVFFFGRHVPYKGINLLIDAEPFIDSDCVILIAGTGPLTEKIKTTISSTRVHMLGRVSNEELKWYLYAASVFAFPSITRNEAFGVALAEAMYCGVPPVTFTINGSGVNWVNLKNITGLEVENSNVVAYATAINELLTNENLRLALGENAAKRVRENFTMSTVSGQFHQLYENI